MILDMGDLSPCVKTQMAEQGTPYALVFVHLLRFIASLWQSRFFLTTDTEVNRSRPTCTASYYAFYSGFLSPVDVVCEAVEATVIHQIQILPLEVILIWARVFFLKAKDWVFQDEFALWGIAAVVDEESTFAHLA